MNKAIQANDPSTYYKPCLKKPNATLKEDPRYNFLKEKRLNLEAHSMTTMCNSRSESNLRSLSKQKVTSPNRVMVQSTPDLASRVID
jgi:hypothetical protein